MSNCRHCQNTCFVIGKTECNDYNPIANRPEQLKQKIREAFAIGNYELGKELQTKLDEYYYGSYLESK